MDPSVGLCSICRHVRIIGNRRGSRFYLCGRSATDPRFRRYPPLPVLRCFGYEPGEVEESAGSEDAPDSVS